MRVNASFFQVKCPPCVVRRALPRQAVGDDQHCRHGLHGFLNDGSPTAVHTPSLTTGSSPALPKYLDTL